MPIVWVSQNVDVRNDYRPQTRKTYELKALFYFTAFQKILVSLKKLHFATEN